MKILVLTKRHHMGQDAYAQLHGRSFAVPEIMAENKDVVIRGVVADYHAGSVDSVRSHTHKVCWELVPVRSRILPRFDRYWRVAKKALEDFKPDVIWAGSDAPISVLGQRLAERTGIPCVIDLKDNYESFQLTRIPGLRRSLHRAIRNASGVTCASSRLVEYAQALGGVAHLLPNAADGSIFYPISAQEAKRALGLPTELRYFGTAGALTRDRNIELLSKAAAKVAGQVAGVALLVAGPRDDSWFPPKNLPVYDLGQIPLSQVGLVFNAMAVGVICNKPGVFGSYCYPQKLHEMRACGLPVIAARTGLFSAPDFDLPGVDTYSANSSSDLGRKLMTQLISNSELASDVGASTWDDRAEELGELLMGACGWGEGYERNA